MAGKFNTTAISAEAARKFEAKAIADAEIQALIKSLEQVAKDVRTETQKALREGAGLIVSAARGAVPVSDKFHYRYQDGETVSLYFPGNLRDSIKAMRFRRARNSLFIGPVAANKSTGVFRPPDSKNFVAGDIGSNAKVDGWYAHFVHDGTENMAGHAFMQIAADRAGPQALKVIVSELKRSIEQTAEREYRKNKRRR